MNNSQRKILLYLILPTYLLVSGSYWLSAYRRFTKWQKAEAIIHQVTRVERNNYLINFDYLINDHFFYDINHSQNAPYWLKKNDHVAILVNPDNFNEVVFLRSTYFNIFMSILTPVALFVVYLKSGSLSRKEQNKPL